MSGARAVVFALTACVLGALFLKGLAGQAPSDPTASTNNGAPQGLLALALLLERDGRALSVRQATSQPVASVPEPAAPASRETFLVPPPERVAWSPAEVREVLALVKKGALDVVLLCDVDKKRLARLSAWFEALGVRCQPGDDDAKRARGTLPGYRGTLWQRDGAQLVAPGGGVIAPAYVDDTHAVRLARIAVGAGVATLLASASSLQNDGIGHGDNAAIALSLLFGERVRVDEAHHHRRARAIARDLLAGGGPKAALVALALLCVLSLLALAPRPGDPPAPQGPPERAAARASVEALAALYLRVGAIAEGEESDEAASEPGPKGGR